MRKAISATWAADLAPEVWAKLLDNIGGDGHAIWNEKPFIDAGVPEDVIDYFSQVEESDTRDPKTTIFNKSGEALAYTKGVYGLSFLEGACANLELESGSGMYHGRGRQARACTDTLRKWNAERCQNGDDCGHNNFSKATGECLTCGEG
jgi:hypothetical protein